MATVKANSASSRPQDTSLCSTQFCSSLPRWSVITSPQWRPASGKVGRTLAQQLAQSSLVVAAPTATFHGSVEQMLLRLKLSDRVVIRARHFGALPELALNTDLLTIVPQMYADNVGKRLDMRVWELPRAAAPSYDVRLVWHASTAKDPAHQ